MEKNETYSIYLLDVDKRTKRGFLCKWYIIISQNRIQKSPDVIELDAWLTNTFSAEKAFRVRGNTRMYVRILVRLLIDFAFCPYPPNFEFNYVECLLAISTFFQKSKALSHHDGSQKSKSQAYQTYKEWRAHRKP